MVFSFRHRRYEADLPGSHGDIFAQLTNLECDNSLQIESECRYITLVFARFVITQSMYEYYKRF